MFNLLKLALCLSTLELATAASRSHPHVASVGHTLSEHAQAPNNSTSSTGTKTLRPNAYNWLPLPDIKPSGWLATQARIQAATLCGHLQYFFVNGSQVREKAKRRDD